MPTSIISGDDLRYYVQQSPTQLATIMGQMTTLIQDIADTQNDTTTRVESMEKQGWFKRMWATVSGKNKATKVEIQKNQDKVVSYVSQAVAQCYQMNCIDQQAICSLGNRMNQVYSQVNNLYNEQLQMKAQIAEIQAIQQQTLQALGGFVTKLNEKIESVDNFHMLITEIQQGQYNDSSRLYSLCCILAQLDKRTLDDSRKLGILKEALIQSKIINDTEISISKYLMDILGLPEDKIGVMYLELCNFRNSFPANLFADIIETYHFLPKMEKMSKKKETIVQRLLDKYDLDESAGFSYIDISESFIENKQSDFININDLQTVSGNAPALALEANETTSQPMLSTNNPKLDQAIQLFLQCKFKDALSLFTDLAHEGNGRAMYFLGEYYSHGTYGIPKNSKNGEYWRKKGAEAGDPLAKLNNGYNYDINSYEREKIIDEVLSIIEQMAESGDVIAQNELSDLYLGQYPKIENHTKGIELLKRSAENGYFRSEFKLGCYYEYGDYVTENEEEAAKWYRKAAEKGYSEAQNALGLCYNFGNGVTENEEEAVKWYRKAAEQELAVAQSNLGDSYYYGYGVEANDKEAFKWFSKAAEQGIPAAQNSLGDCYWFGHGVNQNKSKAKDYWLKAAEKGYVKAIFNIGIYYRDVANNISKAIEWLKKAAEKDYIYAKVRLGEIYRNKKQDYSKAYSYFKQAAEENEPEAQNYLGLMFDNGEYVSQNSTRAVEWYRKSAEHEYAPAQYNLGYSYYYGDGVNEDKLKAKLWIKKAAKQGYEAAIEFLNDNF